ncbi:hypothetical protein [Cupriavidus pauculus]|uniref:hypothetical protein n=1 Tax=Cupriavidus pauculus TaxID=82633 RepID=UPI001FD567AD|nr:hypothetical protein [Cupriavidus pauculus]
MLIDPTRAVLLLLFMTALGMACGFWIGRINERDKRREPERFKVIPRGTCIGCLGRGSCDEPPWGIVRCDECGGTGRARTEPEGGNNG